MREYGRAGGKTTASEKAVGGVGRGLCGEGGANNLGRFSPPIPNIRQVFVFKTCAPHHPLFFFFCQAQSEAHGPPSAMSVRISVIPEAAYC